MKVIISKTDNVIISQIISIPNRPKGPPETDLDKQTESDDKS